MPRTIKSLFKYQTYIYAQKAEELYFLNSRAEFTISTY